MGASYSELHGRAEPLAGGREARGSREAAEAARSPRAAEATESDGVAPTGGGGE